MNNGDVILVMKKYIIFLLATLWFLYNYAFI